LVKPVAVKQASFLNEGEAETVARLLFFTWGRKQFKNRREFLKAIEANLALGSKGLFL
jgi:hypothetical protein